MIPSARSTNPAIAITKFVGFLLNFEKWTNGQSYVQTTCVKIMICGSVEGINRNYLSNYIIFK